MPAVQTWDARFISSYQSYFSNQAMRNEHCPPPQFLAFGENSQTMSGCLVAISDCKPRVLSGYCSCSVRAQKTYNQSKARQWAKTNSQLIAGGKARECTKTSIVCTIYFTFNVLFKHVIQHLSRF